MTKIIEEYIIEDIKETFGIIKDGFLNYRSIILRNNGKSQFNILRGCSKDGAMRSIEGYLIGRHEDELKAKNISFEKAGWLEQFQTYPTKSRGKK